MILAQNLLKPLLSVFLSSILLTSSFLFQAPVFAIRPGLPPPVSDLAKTFSNKYCGAISEGNSSQTAAKVAGGEMISGLVFSGALKELRSIPRQEMVSYLDAMIIDRCGDEIKISEQELNKQMLELADGALGGFRAKF